MFQPPSGRVMLMSLLLPFGFHFVGRTPSSARVPWTCSLCQAEASPGNRQAGGGAGRGPGGSAPPCQQQRRRPRWLDTSDMPHPIDTEALQDLKQPGAVTLQGLQPVPRRYSQFFQGGGRIDLNQFAHRYAGNGVPAAALTGLEERPGPLFREAFDHAFSLYSGFRYIASVMAAGAALTRMAADRQSLLRDGPSLPPCPASSFGSPS